jgi:predicted nucleic acid-binding protein
LSLYIDASAAVSLFIDDVHSQTAKQVVGTSTAPPFLSSWTSAEFSSTAMRLWRGGAMSEPDLTSVLADFDIWSKRFSVMADVESSDVELAARFVRDRRTKLRVPDAFHVAICQRIGAELLTFDAAMSEAARLLGLSVATV